MANKSDQSRWNRRQLLAGIGASVVGAGVPVTKGARTPPLRAMYNRALAARRATGSNEAFRDELRQRGAAVLEKDQHFSAPWTDPEGTNGGIGTLKLDQADCSLQLTMTTYNNTDYLYVDLYWEHEVGYNWYDNEGGEVPDDIVGITFEGIDYDLVGDTWYSGNSTSKYKNDHNGVVFKYCDSCCNNYDGGCPDLGNTYTISDNCGFMLQVDQTSDPDLRQVYTDYWHTYSEVVIQSVSIGAGGALSVSLSDETKKWLKEDYAVESDF